MTVEEFNAKFEQFEGQKPTAEVITKIVEVIEANGCTVIEGEKLDDLTDYGDGLYEMGICLKDKPSTIGYAFGVGVGLDGEIEECGIEEETW
jgi:hypothetical protein